MIHTSAPLFMLLDGQQQSHALQDYRGRYVILIFYPGNDTPVCNLQLKAFNAELETFLSQDIAVFGLNPASVEKHSDYCDRKGLKFPILSDPKGQVAKLYRSHLGWLPINKRTVVVVDPSGVIIYYQRGNPAPEEVKQAIQTHQRLVESLATVSSAMS